MNTLTEREKGYVGAARLRSERADVGQIATGPRRPRNLSIKQGSVRPRSVSVFDGFWLYLAVVGLPLLGWTVHSSLPVLVMFLIWPLALRRERG